MILPFACGSCFALGEAAVSESSSKQLALRKICFHDGVAFPLVFWLFLATLLSVRLSFSRFAEWGLFRPWFHQPGCHSGARWNCVHAGALRAQSPHCFFLGVLGPGRVDRIESCDERFETLVQETISPVKIAFRFGAIRSGLIYTRETVFKSTRPRVCDNRYNRCISPWFPTTMARLSAEFNPRAHTRGEQRRSARALPPTRPGRT